MLVSTIDENGNSKSWLRGGHECMAIRNGSFIEIHYKKNDQFEWIRILPSDMEKMLRELPNWKANNTVKIIMEYDEEYTREMALRDFSKAIGREVTNEEVQSITMQACRDYLEEKDNEMA